MTNLLLIKHSLPDIQPDQPASHWQLSPEGRRRCTILAEILHPYQPQVLYASIEPKAQETAQLVAKSLQLVVESFPGLHEHQRENVPFESTDSFRASVYRFFASPEALVYGNETALQAQERFARAVNTLLAKYPTQNLAIVAHGTVITLYLSSVGSVSDPYTFWQRLGLPSLVVLSRPNLELVSVVDTIE